jgi:hypothetical protein
MLVAEVGIESELGRLRLCAKHCVARKTSEVNMADILQHDGSTTSSLREKL